MSEGAESGAKPQRVVAIGIDGSENSKYAFHCKYYTLYNIRSVLSNYHFMNRVLGVCEWNSILHSAATPVPKSCSTNFFLKGWDICQIICTWFLIWLQL